ncbi:MAG: FAD-dependent oxidoreductase [Anaerolineae bacterium]|nr:FAD-dependent oxidoreductase [Anaerolineae bacterium]
MHSIPILIIGAGPAGLSTAMHLLQINPAWKDQIILLEKATHPATSSVVAASLGWGWMFFGVLGSPSRYRFRRFP